MRYEEEDYLMLSGIQHFYYCKRQWCLIHVEQQWADNQWTAEGHLVHEKADNPYLKEKRKNKFISGAIPVSSSTLGFSGTLDVVEFTKDENGIQVPGKKGKWSPVVVEFKRGKNKKDLRDIVQLVAQVICLEEKFQVEIPMSYLYYNQTNDKVAVEITSALRNEVQELSDEMHYLFDHGITLGPEYCKCDKGCSLSEISMPSLAKRSENVVDYLKNHMEVDLV